MHQSCGFRIITDASVKEGSERLRLFVAKYYQEKLVLGIPCWVAFTVWTNNGYKQGVAPNSTREDFSTEFERLGAETESFKFSESWDDGCIEHSSED